MTDRALITMDPTKQRELEKIIGVKDRLVAELMGDPTDTDPGIDFDNLRDKHLTTKYLSVMISELISEGKIDVAKVETILSKNKIDINRRVFNKWLNLVAELIGTKD
jgi:hypothetical protein